MSPRNRVLPVLWATVLGVLLGTAVHIAPVQAGDTPGMESNLKPEPKNMFIRFYQDHISGADGGRCPMTPSCSEYAARAIEKHGPVIGWIMACDRLVRCGRDELNISPTVTVNNQSYVSDPVDANDFWWFKKDPLPNDEKHP